MDVIRSFTDIIKEVDTEGTEPMFSGIDITCPYRSDEEKEKIPSSSIIDIAPDREGEFVAVERMM